ncbi:hypothetical protein NKR23_g10334 [Pleurostoma richardsiae]|uniref:Ubiquitin-like domain-containing protein n=1 Tax=Pleurostoma richardsiae TaxID=41990 RepID=A0AA38RD11_9PEZI|nr:hypothetical protein NKR23_g10334 [Pleurostoma richardsiae]
MAEPSNQPAAPAGSTPRKKKPPLMFQRIALKRKPDEIRDGPGSAEKKVKEDDGLDLFRRSKDYFEEFAGDLGTQSDNQGLKSGTGGEEHGASPSPKHRKVPYEKFYEGMSEEALRDTERQMEMYSDGNGEWEVKPGLIVYSTPTSAGKRKSQAEEPNPSPASVPSTGGSNKRIRLKLNLPRRDSTAVTSSGQKVSAATGDLLPTPNASDSRETPATPRRIIPLDDDSSDEPISASRGRSARKDKQATATQSKVAPAISLDDDDDDDDDYGFRFDDDDNKNSNRDDISEEAASSLDEPPMNNEFAAYIEAARREIARNAAAPNSVTPASPGESAEMPEPIFKMVILSRLNRPAVVKPLAVQRRLSQNMKLVRDTWISRAIVAGAISPEERDDVFLTWRGSKIYGTTTGLSLGLRPDANGWLEPRAYEEGGYSRGSLLLEAWTEEDYQAEQEERERQRRRDRGEYSDDDEMSDMQSPVVNEEDEEKIRVILKARDTEPVKLTAWASTDVNILIAAYRKQRTVPPDCEISLYFDGDKLAEDSTVGDADIGDMETVEVHIK